MFYHILFFVFFLHLRLKGFVKIGNILLYFIFLISFLTLHYSKKLIRLTNLLAKEALLTLFYLFSSIITNFRSIGLFTWARCSRKMWSPRNIQMEFQHPKSALSMFTTSESLSNSRIRFQTKRKSIIWTGAWSSHKWDQWMNAIPKLTL